jgi:hypothetical protein
METFFQLVEEAIDLNREVRKTLLPYEDSIETLTYNMDNATIHIAVGRGIGKTSYIVQNAQKDDLIIVHNKNAKWLVEKKVDRKNSPTILTPEELQRFFRGQEIYFKNIYIDEPRLVGFEMNRVRIARKEFYMMTSKDKRQTYILLGI